MDFNEDELFGPIGEEVNTEPTGQQPPKVRPQGQRPPQARPQQGQRPQGQRPPQARPQGQRPQGHRPSPTRPQGQRPPQARPQQGQRPQGHRPSPTRPQGQRPPQARPQQGQRPQGHRPSPTRPQGQHPQGQRPPQAGGQPMYIDRTGQPMPQGQKRRGTSVVPDPNVRHYKGREYEPTGNYEMNGLNYQQGYGPQGQADAMFADTNNPQAQPKKKSKFLFYVVVLIIVAILGVVVYNKYIKKEEKPAPKPQEIDYSGTPNEVLKSVQTRLHEYNAEAIDKLIGPEEGDSYLAQEWSYANGNPVREQWIKKATSVVDFTFPKMTQYDTEGNAVSGAGVESDMTDGQGLHITVIDYDAVAQSLEAKRQELEDEFTIKGYTEEDYDYQNECIDLMLSYLNAQESLPIKSVPIDISLDIENGQLVRDAAIDDAIFGSDSWHNLCDAFDKIYTKFTGTELEEYKEKEEVHNDEYDRWYKLFKKYYKKDKGHFHKGTSKWEPWYKRNKKNKILKDKNGKKIVNYYSVKDKKGKDWIQPSKTKWVTVTKQREVPIEYEPEKAVTRCFIGANYCQNVYQGKQNASVRVGDGTLEAPAGIGTPIITKVLCTDGQYHDVRVAMTGYWQGNAAISYCVTFSEKNRGIDPESVLQLVCYELSVENLEKEDITIVDSEMMLCDKQNNQSPRSGFMYGFTNENTTIPAKSVVTINDWGTSTEILQKYAVWGKSFDRQFKSVYFKILAGTGNVPKYSAYKAFTNEMYKSGSNEVDPKNPTTPTPEPTPAPTPYQKEEEDD